MSYCPKCGNKVDETMTFCPRCGASLKAETTARPVAPPTAYPRQEKREKGEKQEKREPEKGEKQEKGQHGYIGWLIGGLVLIVIGIFAYAQAFNILRPQVGGALFLLIIGLAIIGVAIYLATARRRNPVPPA